MPAIRKYFTKEEIEEGKKRSSRAYYARNAKRINEKKCNQRRVKPIPPLELSGEIWKNIEGYDEPYQVSNLGRIRTLNYYKRGITRVLQIHKRKDGYTSTFLRKNGKGIHVRLHRLVAIAFIPNPNNLPNTHHINHKRDDNRAENLMWVTQSENCLFDYKDGVVNMENRCGEKHYLSVLTEKDIPIIKEMQASGKSVYSISKIYKVDPHTIWGIIKGKTWKHIKI